MEQSKERLEILQRIKQYEREGHFNIDVENDPPTVHLKPGEVDYLRQKLSSKIKTHFVNKKARKFINDLIKEKQLVIEDIIGYENFDSLQGGFVITCNHFNQLDNFAIYKCFESRLKNKILYKVIREGNYHAFTGALGLFFKHCNTLPLSSNLKEMERFLHATDTLLQRGEKILVYPEQAMWWNYKKPRPLQSGAFKIAVRADCPILPCFITMRDGEGFDQHGFPVQKYTIHILSPIFPNKELSNKENINEMKEKNYNAWKEVYGNVYNTPLVYEEEE